MRAEAPPKIPGVIFTGVSSLAFPLLNHKIESDRAGKHEKWTKQTHFLATGLAILTDAGVGSAAAILAIVGNYTEAGLIKLGYHTGVDTIPQIIVDLKNKITKNNPNQLSSFPHPK